VNQTASPNISDLKSEIARFKEELSTRDRLVEQLSQELFRLVKNNSTVTPRMDSAGDTRAEIRLLREELQGVERQVKYYQEQLQRRDVEIYQLRHTVRELNERSQMLEQVIRELPKIYTQKFAERLAPIKEKILSLQAENRQLQADLQAVTDRLTSRKRSLEPAPPRLNLEVPHLKPPTIQEVPVFNHA
jgi:chromosome segregation ATPase